MIPHQPAHLGAQVHQRGRFPGADLVPRRGQADPLLIGVGTRFRARMGRAGRQMLVELTEFDRPDRLGSRTTSSMMDTSGALTFAADAKARS